MIISITRFVSCICHPKIEKNVTLILYFLHCLYFVLLVLYKYCKPVSMYDDFLDASIRRLVITLGPLKCTLSYCFFSTTSNHNIYQIALDCLLMMILCLL